MWPKNVTLGNGTLYMDHDHPLAKTIPKIDLSEPIPDYVKSVHFPLSTDVELEANVDIDCDVFSKLAGVDLANNADLSYTIRYSGERQVQIRRHKKKRINKKWAKRYGFKTVYDKVELRDVSIVPKGEGMYEFVTNRRPIYTKGY